ALPQGVTDVDRTDAVHSRGDRHLRRRGHLGLDPADVRDGVRHPTARQPLEQVMAAQPPSLDGFERELAHDGTISAGSPRRATVPLSPWTVTAQASAIVVPRRTPATASESQCADRYALDNPISSAKPAARAPHA